MSERRSVRVRTAHLGRHARAVALIALLHLASACTVSRDAARSESAGAAANGRPAMTASDNAALASGDAVRPAAAPGEPAASFPSPSRPVAGIVAPRWTNEDARDDAGEFGRVAKVAAIQTGTRVADIGAGDGYYVVRLSPIVGATGKVFGEDIVLDYLRLLHERVQRDALSNVQLSLGDPHDPRLPANSLDVALMIHMYHEIDQPFGLLYNLAPALKVGGRVVILDLDRPTFGHGTPPALLRCELRAVGYTEISLEKTGDEEYVAVFQAPSAALRPSPAVIRATLAATPCHVAD